MTNTHPSSIKIFQQNLGRSKTAFDDFVAYFASEDSAVAILQEPYTINDAIPQSSSYKIISSDGTSGRPRAAIMLHSTSNALFHSILTKPDICVCTITLHNTQLNLISIYIPPRRDASGNQVSILPWLTVLETAVDGLSGNIFVGGDFNSHHHSWGSNRTDDRGLEVCDLMAASGLHPLNTGSTPTFFTMRDGVAFSSSVDLSGFSYPPTTHRGVESY